MDQNRSEVLLRKARGVRKLLKIHRLYRSAFPPAERKPFGIILKMAHRGTADLWCLEAEGNFLGMAATINGDELIMLDYFAVTEGSRGKGIGSDALKQLIYHYRERGLFVEIESTGLSGSGIPQKRKDFYLAAGLQELHTRAVVFGVEMELLGIGCSLDFDDYREFYRKYYSPWAADHIQRI